MTRPRGKSPSLTYATSNEGATLYFVGLYLGLAKPKRRKTAKRKGGGRR